MSVELRENSGRYTKLGEFNIQADDAEYILSKLDQMLYYRRQENVAGIINVKTEINIRIEEMLK